MYLTYGGISSGDSPSTASTRVGSRESTEIRSTGAFRSVSGGDMGILERGWEGNPPSSRVRRELDLLRAGAPGFG